MILFHYNMHNFYIQVSHTALRKLNLQHCKIDDVNCIKLCASLHSNDTLESLNFSQNNLEKLEVKI